MRIFLTGATGYIGVALCRRLSADGHEVRALVRPTSETGALEEMGVALFEGDIGDRYSMREGMSGADWVIHAAAELDFEAADERMREVNIQGSENVASLAFKLGVGRMLAISSIAAFGGSPPDGSASTEESLPSLPLPTSYSVTKRGADEAIATWEDRGLKVNTVYPSLVYGPPGKKQGFNTLLAGVLERRFPAIIGADRIVTMVYIDDLVEGIVRVIGKAAPGEKFLLTGEAIELGSLIRETARLGEVPPPKRALSVGTAALAMWLLAPFFRLRGRRPPLTPSQLANVKRHWNFDDSKARERLGWRPRPLADGLGPTVEYLRKKS